MLGYNNKSSICSLALWKVCYLSEIAMSCWCSKIFFFFLLGDDDEMPQELLLGKHQLSELGSESAKIKAMGIMDRVSYCHHNIKQFKKGISSKLI